MAVEKSGVPLRKKAHIRKRTDIRLFAHFAVVLHIPQAAVSQQLGNRPVIKVHLYQLHAVVMTVYVRAEAEEVAVVIPDILFMDHSDDPPLNRAVLQRAFRVLIIHEDILGITVWLLFVYLFQQRQQFIFLRHC